MPDGQYVTPYKVSHSVFLLNFQTSLFVLSGTGYSLLLQNFFVCQSFTALMITLLPVLPFPGHSTPPPSPSTIPHPPCPIGFTISGHC